MRDKLRREGKKMNRTLQCDQMAKLFSQYLFSENWPNRMSTFAKVDLCQILNKPSRNCRRLLKFCQSREILANLVALAERTERKTRLHASKLFLRC